jgi:hypothetical protein
MDFKKNGLSCLQFNSGKELSINQYIPTFTSATTEDYVKFVYPLMSNKVGFSSVSLNDLYNNFTFLYINAPVKKNNKIIYTKNNGILYENTNYNSLRFNNTQYIEVALQETTFKNMLFSDWHGCWYDFAKGSGYFIPVKSTMMAFNSLDCLRRLKISPDIILQYSSSNFKQQIINSGKTIQQVLDMCSVLNFKYNYTGNEINVKKFITSMVSQRGYKTLQLLSEFDGNFMRQFFVDILDPNLSTQQLVRRNPLQEEANSVKSHWYLNTFNSDSVSEDLIIMPQVEKQFNEFPFKEQCRLSDGTISIKDVYLNCLKILKYGLPSQILLSESTNYQGYAKGTMLEKLQSYFTIVYGNSTLWKSKGEAELLKRFQYIEIYYLQPLKSLGLTPDPKGVRQANPLYSDPAYPWYNPNILHAPYKDRPAELMSYIEVFRQNERYSLVEIMSEFAAFYYFPCKGSGYFIPTGKMLVTENKEQVYSILGQPVLPNSWENDKMLARTLMYKGFDTLILLNFADRQELANVRDPIESQMSLIRTDPFDVRVNSPSDLLDPHVVPGNFKANCLITHQFDGSIDALCAY